MMGPGALLGPVGRMIRDILSKPHISVVSVTTPVYLVKHHAMKTYSGVEI
jgi:hypothetical protein